MTSVSNDVRQIFLTAVEQYAPEQWPEYLHEVCGDDAALRSRVETLLAAHRADYSLLDKPALMPAQNPEATCIEPASEHLPGKSIGPYKLREQIGEGGMGVVYVAEQTQPIRRRVALKVIKPGMDTKEVVGRFETERQALALMDHPNIAKVLDAGTTDSGRPFFVMELVPGRPLNEYCDQANVGLRDRLSLFVLVCQAVQHAHQKGIIHRDLKPSNVLIMQHDDQPVPKVIDFGVAKALHQKLSQNTVYTQQAQILGTPLYMSPEQAGQGALDIDTRSDVYSLGVLLYELLTGTTPITRNTLTSASVEELRRIIREDDPPRPSARLSTLDVRARATIADQRHIDPRKICDELRGELDWIVMQALEKDRSRRYESASALAADIQRHLNHEPVLACPPSATYRLLKTIRRYKVAAATVGLVSCVVLTSAAFSMWKFVAERAARQDADQQKSTAIANARQADLNAAEANREREEAQRQRDEARRNLYFADTNLAFVDISSGLNIGRARDTLLSYVPRPGEVDQRGWEWYYLLGRTKPEEQTLYGHGGEVKSVDWSPDGKYLASAGTDGTVKVWEATTWSLMRTLDKGVTYSVALDWSPDSRHLAWGSSTSIGTPTNETGEAALRIWDRETNTIRVLHGHSGGVYAVAWSRNGRFVATGSGQFSKPPESGNVRIWDVETLECVAQFTTEKSAYSISWSADDAVLAVGHTAGLLLCDVASGTATEVNEVRGLGLEVAWHPTEPRLALAMNFGYNYLVMHHGKDSGWLPTDRAHQVEHECLVWDHAAGRIISRWISHPGRILAIAWSPDGHQLLSASIDGKIKLWDVSNGREIRTVNSHVVNTSAVDWHPTGKQFASGGGDHVLRIWGVNARRNPLVIEPEVDGDFDLAWNSDSSAILLYNASTGQVDVWDTQSGEPIERIPIAQSEGRRLVSFQYLVEQKAVDAETLETLQVLPVPKTGALSRLVPSYRDNHIPPHIAVSPNGNRIAHTFFYFSDAAKNALIVHDVHSHQEIHGSNVPPRGVITWSPDGRWIAVAGQLIGRMNSARPGAYIHIFEADTGARRHLLEMGPDSAHYGGRAIAWSHDGSRIAVADMAGLCQIWDWKSETKLISKRVHAGVVMDMEWSPDDLRIASGGDQQHVLIWDAATGQQLLSLDALPSRIQQIRWSPDGRKLAAVSYGRQIKVWDASAGYAMPHRDDWWYLLDPRGLQAADQLIEAERWPEAAAELQQMIVAGNRNAGVFYRLAAVQLQLQDEPAYRRTCERMLTTFAKTETSAEACNTAWTCALHPAALTDYGTAIAMAELGCEQEVDSRHQFVSPNASLRLAAILFRAGRYDDALQQLQVLNEHPWRELNASWPAQIACLMAMTQHQLGHAPEALTWLERAKDEVNKRQDDPEEQPEWDERLILNLWLEEATQMITGKTPVGRASARAVGNQNMQ